VKRAEFRAVALARLLDAQALLRSGRYAGAYYLAGYAVECALKACIARQFHQSDIPRKGLVDRIYVHDLVKLVDLAPLLKDELDQQLASDPVFDVYWSSAVRWSEQTRYLAGSTRSEAADLLEAIANAEHGVLQWLKQHW
jgi:HEPN domain